MHALIIEDQALIAMLIEDQLAELGFTSFDQASTQEQAIASARLRAPDLITADDGLSSGTGTDAVRAICDGQPTPVIFIVGNPRLLRESVGSGIVLGKPFKSHELAAAVRRLLPAGTEPTSPQMSAPAASSISKMGAAEPGASEQIAG